MLERKLLLVLESTVRRGVIDAKDLQLKIDLCNGEHTLDATHERVLLVVSRDNKRELWQFSTDNLDV